MPLSISQLPAGTPWWIFALVVAALALHVGGGTAAIAAGWGAVATRKGETWHRRFGWVFVAAMLVTGAMGATLAFGLHQPNNLAGGILSIYFVSTAWMTVRRKEGTVGAFEKIALLVVLGVAALFAAWGVEARMGAGRLYGYPAWTYFMIAGLSSFFAALDIKVILRGGIIGAQRIARHLWRMCLAFSFASASFFIGQQKAMPASLHGSRVLLALGLAPLVFLAFWMIRVRLTGWYKSGAIAAQA